VRHHGAALCEKERIIDPQITPMKKTEDFLSCLRLAKLIKARGQGRYKNKSPFFL
jgi:hypothetical protein